MTVAERIAITAAVRNKIFCKRMSDVELWSVNSCLAFFPHQQRFVKAHCFDGAPNDHKKGMSIYEFTPLKKPPRWAVRPIAATPSSSRTIRYRGRGIGVLRVRQCTHHDAITKTVAVEAARRCSSKTPLIFWSSRTKCQASQPVSTVGITAAAAMDRFQYAALENWESRFPRDSRSNPTPVMNNAIGK